MARRGQSQAPDPGAHSRSAGFPPTPSPTHPLPPYTIVMYTAPPLLKEKLPRLPWPGLANHKPPILGLTHGAPGSPPPPAPPPTPQLARLAPLREHHSQRCSLSLCLSAASVSVGKKSPSLKRWGTGAELDSASTSMAGGCSARVSHWLGRTPVQRSFFAAGGGAAAASTSELLTVMALLVASLPLLLPLPLPLPLLLPLPQPLPPSLPLPLHDPASDSGSGSAESSASTTMRQCNFVARAGWVRWLEPSVPDTSRGGTYSADESTWVGSGTIATPHDRGTTTTLPFVRSCLCALASALLWRQGRKAPTATYERTATIFNHHNCSFKKKQRFHPLSLTQKRSKKTV